MDGVPVEGHLTLGLELYNERRDGVQALDRWRQSPRLNVDRLWLERLGVRGDSDVREGRFVFLWGRLR